jgi:hypothetical protein
VYGGNVVTQRKESDVKQSDARVVTNDLAEVFPDGTFRLIDHRSNIVKRENGEITALGK